MATKNDEGPPRHGGEPRRDTKVAKVMIDFRLFHSRMIRTEGRGRHLSEIDYRGRLLAPPTRPNSQRARGPWADAHG